MDTVGRMDAHEFSMEFCRNWSVAASTITQDLSTEVNFSSFCTPFQIMTARLDEDVEKAKKDELLGFQSTLPPTWASCDHLAQLQVS